MRLCLCQLFLFPVLLLAIRYHASVNQDDRPEETDIPDEVVETSETDSDELATTEEPAMDSEDSDDSEEPATPEEPDPTPAPSPDPRDVFQYVPLPELVPHPVKVNEQQLDVIAFYAPTVPLTEWDRRTGGGPFGNFWPLHPATITVTHNDASGTFGDTESAYQAFKWWQEGSIRKLFESCSSPTMRGGSCAYKIKKAHEAMTAEDENLQTYYQADYDGLGKYEAMKLVLRQKWRLPEFKKFLLDTKGVFLVEHCAKKGRDLYWTDDLTGGGENRLGAALMVVRGEILLEEGSDTDGWPEGVQRPEYDGGPPESNWQQVVDDVAQQLVADSQEPVGTPAPTAEEPVADAEEPVSDAEDSVESPTTEAPTLAPTETPTVAPTEAPTVAPTESPTLAPTEAPTPAPTGPMCCRCHEKHVNRFGSSFDTLVYTCSKSGSCNYCDKHGGAENADKIPGVGSCAAGKGSMKMMTKHCKAEFER